MQHSTGKYHHFGTILNPYFPSDRGMVEIKDFLLLEKQMQNM